MNHPSLSIIDVAGDGNSPNLAYAGQREYEVVDSFEGTCMSLTSLPVDNNPTLNTPPSAFPDNDLHGVIC